MSSFWIFSLDLLRGGGLGWVSLWCGGCGGKRELRRAEATSPVYFWMGLGSFSTLAIMTVRRLEFVSYLCLNYLARLT
jgi:hypothetical protein